MNKKNVLRLLIALFVTIPLISFFLVNVVFLAYIYWFQNFEEMQMPAIDSTASHHIFLVHGLRDTADSWTHTLKQFLEKRGEAGVQVISLDWNPYSQNTFRCSIDGKRIGRLIGEQLLAAEKLTSLHLIGHSCGSFVVLGVCETVKKQRRKITVQTTYLDPVAIYGGLFWDYGIDHFGTCGDFSDAYIDTEDGVPGSNQLLPNTHTFNVTAVRKAGGFKGNPHVWPTIYYQQLAESGIMPEYRKDKSLVSVFPKGVMTDVKP